MPEPVLPSCPLPPAGMAAYGCIKALNTLLSSVSGLPELLPTLEEILFPIMQKMISTTGQDVFEEVNGGQRGEGYMKWKNTFGPRGTGILPKFLTTWRLPRGTGIFPVNLIHTIPVSHSLRCLRCWPSSRTTPSMASRPGSGPYGHSCTPVSSMWVPPVNPALVLYHLRLSHLSPFHRHLTSCPCSCALR